MKYSVHFEMDRSYGVLVLEATSEKKAREAFEMLSADEVMDMATIIPEFEIDYVEEDD